MVKIAVIGGGINGLGCAVKIKNKYKNYQVTLISKDFSPNTTGDGSGGLWYPYLCKNTPSHLIDKWSAETLAYYRELWITGAVDLCLLPIYELATKENTFNTPSWSKFVYGYMELDSKQLKYFGEHHSCKYFAGLAFITFIVPPPALLAYLKKKFLESNGEIIQGEITSLKDEKLKDFDVVINCTGLGARTVVPDEKMVPVRGQIIKVKADWVSESFTTDRHHYIIPNVNMCVMGGTQQSSYTTEVDQKDIEHIVSGCTQIIPGLKHAPTLSHWVGLRPGRDSVRLEPEYIDGKLYIHNYGHGGSGFTLFWGCSSDVLKILEHHINKNTTSKL